jgi:hypothetical protein
VLRRPAATRLSQSSPLSSCAAGRDVLPKLGVALLSKRVELVDDAEETQLLPVAAVVARSTAALLLSTRIMALLLRRAVLGIAHLSDRSSRECVTTSHPVRLVECRQQHDQHETREDQEEASARLGLPVVRWARPAN